MLSYKLTLVRPCLLEFQLLSVSGDFVRFMIKHRKVYITGKGVIVQMLGNRLTLDEHEGPNDDVVGISLPEKIGLISHPPQIEYTATRKFTNNADFESYTRNLVEALTEAAGQAREEALRRAGKPSLPGNPVLLVLGDSDQVVTPRY